MSKPWGHGRLVGSGTLNYIELSHRDSNPRPFGLYNSVSIVNIKINKLIIINTDKIFILLKRLLTRYVHLKRRFLQEAHGVTSQKIAFFNWYCCSPSWVSRQAETYIRPFSLLLLGLPGSRLPIDWNYKLLVGECSAQWVMNYTRFAFVCQVM
jgi:hypothetical protein